MRNLLLLGILITSVATAALAADPQTDDQKAFYAIGASMAKQLAPLQPMTPQEIELLTSGLTDGLSGKPLKASPEAFGPKIQEIAKARMTASAETEKKKGQEFVEKAAKEKGAKKTESGLVYEEITPGSGSAPAATDTVKVNYRGTLIDGTEFDSSYKRGQPATFPLNGVIKCWTEGLQLMKPGGKAKLVCPADIAYGDRGAPPKIKPGATLVFDVELLELMKDQPPAAGAAPKEGEKKEEKK